MAKDRLDVYLGNLRGQLDADAAALGKAPGELLRAAYQDWRLGQSLIKDQVRQAVVDLARAIDDGELADSDPVDSPAAVVLAALLGSAYAAEGIAEALEIIWTKRTLPAARGLELNETALAWLDELVDQAEQPHTRETMLEKLIGDAWRKRHA